MELNPTPASPARQNRLADLAHNLIAGLNALALRKAAPMLRVGVAGWILLELLSLAIDFAFDFAAIGPEGRFVSDALGGKLFHLPWLMLAVWFAACLAGRREDWLRGVVGLAALWIWLSLLWNVFALLPAELWDGLGNADDFVWWAPAGWGLLASVVLLGDAFDAAMPKRLGMLLIVALCYLAPTIMLGSQMPLWAEAPIEDDGREAARWQAARSEAAIYRQPLLLTEAISRVEPGEAGRAELFLLAVAGHGAQDVFLREADKVERLFSERFGTAGHSIVLVNNPATVLDRPLATVSAIEASLRALGERMDDEDVLFVFLTSHGAEDHRFDLSMWPWELEQLTPQRLGALLDAAGIRHRVILVSACYSGGFVAPLAGPDTLVMAAARADRSSHGCSHEADWTFFGRAFFDEALRETSSFTEAFARARAAVGTREAAEGLEASEPQMAIGEAIKARLDGMAAGWPHTLQARRLDALPAGQTTSGECAQTRC
ncbi:C13 family peptidase [Methyloversatilis sp.]|uniref:C13 family peptidase n=1 Tax=Methyloversatilis sp. TaxID=2569862 RepID=UPI0035AFBE08